MPALLFYLTTNFDVFLVNQIDLSIIIIRYNVLLQVRKQHPNSLVSWQNYDFTIQKAL